MEEGTELLQRLNKYLAGDRTVKIPLMTSCCPGWVSFMEKHFPELGENLSTAKSPQQMFGAIAKTTWRPSWASTAGISSSYRSCPAWRRNRKPHAPNSAKTAIRT